MAMRHLIELGHRRIAYCNFDGTQGLRGAGHERALREWNMCLGSTVSPRVGFGEAGADQRHPARAIEIPGATFSQWLEAPHLMAEYFQSPDAPTGLLAWNDHRALMILGMLSRAGLRVPEQVSLMGYDALPEGQMVHPALTTLSTQIEQQVQLAMGLLTRPAPTPAGHSVVLVPSLVPGETTQRAPKPMF
jgi:DNA-binding LacI/PurR family transcriptional regulator